jgi:Sigma-70 region 2
MSADTRLEELGVSGPGASGLGEVDEPAFSGMAQRHHRELHVHCYRMLGSFEDAEDTVQETFLRAWRRRETFEGRSTFRGSTCPPSGRTGPAAMGTPRRASWWAASPRPAWPRTSTRSPHC